MAFPILTVVTFLPAVGASLLLLLRREDGSAIRALSLLFALLTFIVSLPLFFLFDAANGRPQFAEVREWIPALGITYSLGVDGMSLLLVLLTTFLTPIAVLSTFRAVSTRVKEFHIALLALETGMLGAFVARDLLLFYVFWEVMLIPMFLLIGVWGGEARVWAAVKFFIYTMAGSLLMFAAILFLYWHVARTTGGSGSFALDRVREATALRALTSNEQFWLFLAFGLAFAIKVPVFPFHTWLPLAHTEAPTAGSVILAAVLLKMGGYGFLRFSIPLFPDAAVAFAPFMLALGVIGVVYGALMSLAQSDVKKLIAYSSVSHLGFVVIGIFALTAEGVAGAIYQMLNHGLSTGGLFLMVGVLYERRHTRQIADYGGIAQSAPGIAAVLFFIVLSSIALPGLNGFVGEYLILLGTFKTSPAHAALAATGVVLGAAYSLWMYQRVALGPLKNEANRKLADLDAREWAYMLPVMAMCVIMGALPGPFLRRLAGSVETILGDEALKRSLGG